MELELHETAVGDCLICGSFATGSRYWLGMTAAQWDIVRPLVKHLFKPDMVQNVLFIPQICKPLCGSHCAVKHREIEDGKVV
jgi:hypothetical protein